MKRINALLLLLLLPFLSFSWHANGHMTCGAVAYYYLKANNPATLAKVLAIFKRHPWFTTARWHDKLSGLTEEQKNVTLFMLASTFPDDARSVPGLGGPILAKWHFIDYPFVPAGQSVHAPAPEMPNAEEKINELISSINTEPNAAQKAIDLCWLFHLVEDIHQPLHAASMFNSGHPTGDRGGNETYIRLTASTQPVILHSYWDDLVKGTLSNIPSHAQNLLHNPKYKETNLPELQTNVNVNDWIVKESFAYAKTNAYLNGAVKGSKTAPTSVSTGYANTAGALAEKRVVLAGIRLAKKLAQIIH